MGSEHHLRPGQDGETLEVGPVRLGAISPKGGRGQSNFSGRSLAPSDFFSFFLIFL